MSRRENRSNAEFAFNYVRTPFLKRANDAAAIKRRALFPVAKYRHSAGDSKAATSRDTKHAVTIIGEVGISGGFNARRE